MAKRHKQSTLTAVTIGILAILFVAVLFFMQSLNWMFTTQQMEIIWMAVVFLGAAVFIFQGKW